MSLDGCSAVRGTGLRSRTWTPEADARAGKTFIEIDGLVPGDLLYVAVKGEEDVKHVCVRVLPYTVAELEVLIKACILQYFNQFLGFYPENFQMYFCLGYCRVTTKCK